MFSFEIANIDFMIIDIGGALDYSVMKGTSMVE